MNPTSLLLLAVSISGIFGLHGQVKEAASSAVDAQAPAAPTASDSYVIGPSYVLTITVWKEPTLSGTILVRPDGMITLPLIGSINMPRHVTTFSGGIFVTGTLKHPSRHLKIRLGRHKQLTYSPPY